MSDINPTTDLQAWLISLTNFLKKNISASIPVVVIALSRKMPRFIEYIKENHTSDLVPQLSELLSDPICTYTTEHAIPFIFKKYSPNTEILILDDIIVTGATLSNVCDEVYQITKIKPYYISIWKCGSIQDLSTGRHVEGYTPISVSKEEVNDILLGVSKCLKSNGLPIDMEFPILHTDYSEVFEPIRTLMLEKCPDCRCYGNEYSFTMLEESEINRMFNNDFAKIRVFKGSHDTRIVGYAPNVLSEYEIGKNSLFTNEDYSSLWSEILGNTIKINFNPDDIILSDEENLRAKVYHRRYKSLTVVANYLFSLSMLIRHKQEYVVNNEKLSLDSYDLQLLIGPKLSNAILPKLTDFFKTGSNSQSLHHTVNTPPYLTPYDYEEDEFMDYDMERFAAVFSADDSSEVVLNVFRASYDMFNQDEDQIEKIRWNGAGNIYYLESFQSFFQLPIIGSSEKLSEKNINQEIDNLIDEGKIIPVYERTGDNDDPLVEPAYWRRYFKAGHTISSDSE